MKIILFIIGVGAAVSLAISPLLRSRAVEIGAAVVDSIGSVAESSQSATVEPIERSNYTQITSQKDRVVCVIVHHGISDSSRKENASIHRAAEQLPGHVTLAPMDYLQNSDLLKKVGVQKLPALCFYKQGKLSGISYPDSLDTETLVRVIEPRTASDGRLLPGSGSIQKMPERETLPPGVTRSR